MKKNRLIPLFVFAFCTTVFITVQVTYMCVTKMWQDKVTDMIKTDRTTISENLAQLDTIAKSDSVYASDTSKLLSGTVNGYLSGLGDKYAMYLNESQYLDYVAMTTQGSSVGIGINALYDMTSGGIYIVNVYPDSPASNVGIVPGDVITQVNGTEVSEKGFYSAMLEIGNGKMNSALKLKVRRKDGTSKDFDLIRANVPVQSITSRLLSRKAGIVRISEFTPSCAEDFKAHVQKLITSGADRFVIDIRNNPGGNTKDIAKLLDFLLPDCVTITGYAKDGTLTQEKSDAVEFTYPLTVIVNENTVCGAELFAAALRDCSQVPLVGKTTYGKASYQQMYTMPDGSAVSISTVLFTTPKGVSFDKAGIAPEYEVSLSDQALEQHNKLSDEDDTQLAKALEIVEELEYTGPDNS